jgi:hypothetical protein
MIKFYTKYRSLIIGTIFGLLIIYIFSTLIIEKRLNSLKVSLEDKIELQQRIISDIALTTGRGGSNNQAEMIVTECSSEERVDFESSLSKLDTGLPNKELNQLSRLFNSCGHVYANRRASMAFQLEREVAYLDDLVAQRRVIDDDYDILVNLEKWSDLVVNEKLISNNFQELVIIQRQIIDSLLLGKTTDSEEVKTLMKDAQSLKNELTTATEKASTIRSELIST